MEVKLEKRYAVQADVLSAWAVLRDIRAVAGCMPGAAITEQVDDKHYKGTVKVKVGPALAAFGGDIEVLELDEAGRRMRMLGKGADKGGSSASMDLTAVIEAGEGRTSVLVGNSAVIVNGKFAQFGGRMMTQVSDMILDQFADNFRAAAGAVAAQAAGNKQAVVTPLPMRELNALALAWGLIKRWFLRLFGRQPSVS
jgi:carbon monoxide dehydrogenase subunit G